MRGATCERGSGGGRGGAWTLAAGLIMVLGLGACGDDGPTDPDPDPEPPPGGVEPAVTLDLDVGDLRVLTDADEVRSFELEGGSGTRQHVVAVSSGSRNATSTTQLRVRVRTSGGVAGAVSPMEGLHLDRSPASRQLRREERASLGEWSLKRAMRDELLRVGARPATRQADLLAPRMAVGSRTVPAVGDTLRFTMGLQPAGTVSCTDTTATVVSVVRRRGARFVLAEDTAVANAFANEQARQDFYGELIAELDDKVYPTDSAYFGAPSDIDGNDRSIVLFTKEVNELTEPGSATFVAGFFFPGDLASEATCPVGNEAELLYLLAPDPDGLFGDTVGVTFAKRNARGVVSHEFQHLLTASQRVFDPGGFGNLEETWLSEGFSHIAEEVSGLAVAGLPVRDNLRLSQAVTSDVSFEAFASFHISNFVRLMEFFNAPSGTEVLADEDPGGTESLRVRGFSWSFLRWAADRFVDASSTVPPGSGEEAFFRELSSGGPGHLSGIDNVVRAVNLFADRPYTWEEILAEYASMPELDDNGPASLPEPTQVKTWDLRDVFLDLHNETTLEFRGPSPFTEEYPLQVRTVTVEGSTDQQTEFGLQAGAQRYFLVQGSAGSTPDAVVEVSAQDGAQVPAAAAIQVTVVRKR